MVTIVYHLLQEAQTAISIRSTVRLRKDRFFAGVIDTIIEIQLHFLLNKSGIKNLDIVDYFSQKTDLDKPSNVRLFSLTEWIIRPQFMVIIYILLKA